jgi:hypothetical protein
MDYILRYPLNSEDIEFLNTTSIEYDLHNHTVDAKNDSGWCDYSTGSRIITTNDRAIFKDPSDSQLTFLQLKYGSRLKELHSGLREIYNVAEE